MDPPLYTGAPTPALTGVEAMSARGDEPVLITMVVDVREEIGQPPVGFVLSQMKLALATLVMLMPWFTVRVRSRP